MDCKKDTGKLVKGDLREDIARRRASSGREAATDSTERDGLDNNSRGYGLISSNDARYRVWWTVVAVAAAFTGFFTPWQLSFADADSLYSLDRLDSIVEVLLIGVFAADALIERQLTSNDASETEHGSDLPTEEFWAKLRIDLLSILPLDVFAVYLAGGPASLQPRTLQVYSLLRLFHLARLDKVRSAFAKLEYDLSLSLFGTTMIRNFAILALFTHWSACGFYWVARLSGFLPESLVGTNAPFFLSLSGAQQYIYSVYWAVQTLTSSEFGNPNPSSIGETISASVRAIMFMGFNIVLGAYILGTITLLVVKADERTGRYRDRSMHLKNFSQANQLPQDLKDSMQEHLKLHFSNEEASDEAVLSIYPTALRRRILRHLYLPHLRSAPLFAGTRGKFLDSVLTTARIEFFMPGVEILSEGEAVNELCLVVQGAVEILTPEANTVLATMNEELEDDWGEAEGQDVQDGSKGPAAASEGVWSQRRVIRESGMFGEYAFFTNLPQLEVVRSLTVCRIMVLSRGAFEGLERQFPVAARTVLFNLQRHAEQLVEQEFPLQNRTKALDRMLRRSPSTRHLNAVSADGDGDADAALVAREARMTSGLSETQESVLSNLVRVRGIVQSHVARMDEERLTQFLYAAAQGNSAIIREMLQQGFDPNSADYDARTALMLAAVNGRPGIVRQLIAAGADVTAVDNFGACALLEACHRGNDEIIDLLVTRGASLSSKENSVTEAGRLCNSVINCNLPLLRRYLRAHANVNAYDYDKRTALHISAAEGNAPVVKLLVEEGRADCSCRDRWGSTPLDEASRVGHAVQGMPAFFWDISSPESSGDCAWAPDGSAAFLGGCDNSVQLWNLQTSQLQAVAAHSQPVCHLGFLPDYNLLATASWDKTLQYWDLRQPKAVTSVALPERVYAFGLQGNLLVLGLAERHVLIFDLKNPSRPFKQAMSNLKFQTRCMAAFPGGDGFVQGSLEGRVACQWLDANSQKNSFSFKCHRDAQGQTIHAVNSVAFHPTMHGTLATAGSDGTVGFWDIKRRQRLKAFPSVGQPISCAAFSSDGALYAYAASYEWSKGYAAPSAHRVVVHPVAAVEVQPKPQTQTSQRR
ncbi:hypothetical protein WJX73_006514 [Symbiochloris irregularis]|uniref:Cyclic nucleotide-binding domain-containing protein n=1 Tax=Symbiochloris irregularis TaxID=706552 RepID=A0AAW1NRT7_9CHLO